MIFSIVEKVSKDNDVQKLMVKGDAATIATELHNIIKELLKRGFPEELICGALLDAIEEDRK